MLAFRVQFRYHHPMTNYRSEIDRAGTVVCAEVESAIRHLLNGETPRVKLAMNCLDEAERVLSNLRLLATEWENQ